MPTEIEIQRILCDPSKSIIVKVNDILSSCSAAVKLSSDDGILSIATDNGSIGIAAYQLRIFRAILARISAMMVGVNVYGGKGLIKFNQKLYQIEFENTKEKQFILIQPE